MEVNILKSWKKEFIWHSSELNPKNFCTRKDIENLEKVFLNYFGEQYFEVTVNQNKSLEKINWIHLLLGQKDLSSLVALFEIGNLLLYLKRLEATIQEKLKSAINSPKEFQNLLFEIYTYRLLDLNKIQNEKKVWKDNQELEGKCWINNEEFIFECRKAYTADFEKFNVIKQIFYRLTQLQIGVELMGYIVLKQNYTEAKKVIFKLFDEYFKKSVFKGGIRVIPKAESKDCKIETMPHNAITYDNLENLDKELDIKFRITSPKTGLYSVEIVPFFSLTQDQITNKLLNTIKKKRRQHKKSKDQNRIIFIDSELGRNLKLPLLSFEHMIEDEKISRMLNEKDTNDIVCIFLRNYVNEIPQVKIKVFCKEKFNDVKAILEGMKTNFDYGLSK